jgi:hypothetical protein
MNDALTATLISVLAYFVAFSMAYTSKAIELSNTYGAYYQFIKLSPRTFFYCGTYGLIGVGGYWLYRSNIKPDLVDTASIGLNSELLVILISAMIIGWSAKGFSDTPLFPYRESEGQTNVKDGFRLSVIISFIFKDNGEQYDLIITKKQKMFFKRCHDDFVQDGNKGDFDKAVYDFLNMHPRYGASTDAAGVVKFNAIMQELASQSDLESSMRYVYRNLGYKIFRTVAS